MERQERQRAERNKAKIFRGYVLRMSNEIKLGRFNEASEDAKKLAGILKSWSLIKELEK